MKLSLQKCTKTKKKAKSQSKEQASITCTEPLEDAVVFYQSLIGGEHGGVGVALLSSDGH